jgi:ribosomal protein S18 acetylase RimI-like enzyme
MTIDYKLLDQTFIGEIHKTWKAAFAEYQVDMSYLTLEKMIHRTRMDRVDFTCSAGAFDGQKMVGFLNIGIDQWKNHLYAWDAGTGVIPDYRGRGIAGQLFDFVVPHLKKRGVEKFSLEVIQENHSAVSAYEKAGFIITGDFNCYRGKTGDLIIREIHVPDLIVKPIKKTDLKRYDTFFDWEITWEYNLSAIENISGEMEILGAFLNNQCVGVMVFDPVMEWIFLLAVDKLHRQRGIGTSLMASLVNKIKENTSLMKFHNLKPGHPINDFLQKLGFEIYCRQYEMERSL